MTTSYPINQWHSSAKTHCITWHCPASKKQQSTWNPIGWFFFAGCEWHLLLCSHMKLWWCSIGTHQCHPLSLYYYMLHCITWYGAELHSVVLCSTLLLLLLIFVTVSYYFFSHQLIVSFYVLLFGSFSPCHHSLHLCQHSLLLLYCHFCQMLVVFCHHKLLLFFCCCQLLPVFSTHWLFPLCIFG